MAQMTNAYFTVVSPFTKMIFSGRGSYIVLSRLKSADFSTGSLLIAYVSPGSTLSTIWSGFTLGWTGSPTKIGRGGWLRPV